jgi:ornithine--oxo-acid transaminase
MPLSAVVADADVLGVLRPGQHGSTFGGNPLACAVGRAVVAMLSDDGPEGILARARHLGAVLHRRLAGLVGNGVVAVRGAGLWAGVDVEESLGTGREVSEAMMRRGVLVKDTHGSTIRISPPMVITERELHEAVDALAGVLSS